MPFYQQIYQIADRTIRCGKSCDDVANAPAQGIVPRGLLLEPGSHPCPAAESIYSHKQSSDNCNCETARDGCVIVGINPGNASDVERAHYKKSPLSYAAILEYWPEIQTLPYFKKLRKVAEAFGLFGPILWSDLAKCECKWVTLPVKATPARMPVSAQTLRVCIHSYLLRELAVAPKYWPIIAVGRTAFATLSAIVAPDRAVIGVPHPTGSFGRTDAFLTDNAKIDQAKSAIANNQALWLGKGR